MKYEPPEHQKKAFTCPYCDVYTSQYWTPLYARVSDSRLGRGVSPFKEFHGLDLALCHNCHKASVWHEQKMIVPTASTAPLPHPDLPPDLSDDYMEARDIVIRSPRGAAALLRLVVQKLVGILGGDPKRLDDGIEDLVQQGKIDVMVQQGLDSVRVIGNESVHPGELDLKDDLETATVLFAIVNEIVDEAIARPARRQAFYAKLPQNALKAIAERPEKRARTAANRAAKESRAIKLEEQQ